MSSPRFSSEVPWWKFFPENPKLNLKPGTSCWIRCWVAKIACRHKQSIQITSLHTLNTQQLTPTHIPSAPSIQLWWATIPLTFIHNTFFPFQLTWTTFSCHQDRNTNLLQNNRSNPLHYITLHYTTRHNNTEAWHLVKWFNTFAPVSEHAWYSCCVPAATWQCSGKNTMHKKVKCPDQRILFLAHQYSLELWPETDLKLFYHFSMFNTRLHLQIELLQYKLSPYKATCINSSHDPTPAASLSGPHITPSHRHAASAPPRPSLQSTQHML
jgi:hypothetical protein